MRPIKSTSEAEWKVIRWFFGPVIIAVFIYLAFAWWQRAHECSETCEAKGFDGGKVRFNKGGRFNMGTYCECVSQARKKENS